MDKNRSLTEQFDEELEKIKSEMCDHYCKYTEGINRLDGDVYDEVIETICGGCPLVRL